MSCSCVRLASLTAGAAAVVGVGVGGAAGGGARGWGVLARGGASSDWRCVQDIQHISKPASVKVFYSVLKEYNIPFLKKVPFP